MERAPGLNPLAISDFAFFPPLCIYLVNCIANNVHQIEEGFIRNQAFTVRGVDKLWIRIAGDIYSSHYLFRMDHDLVLANVFRVDPEPVISVVAIGSDLKFVTVDPDSFVDVQYALNLALLNRCAVKGFFAKDKYVE